MNAITRYISSIKEGKLLSNVLRQGLGIYCYSTNVMNGWHTKDDF
jgi:hypothetical protein